MNFPLYIAKRYVRSRSSQNAVNIINFITFLVIVIGSAALFLVLSGFAGLKTFSLSFTNAFDPDLKAQPAIGKVFSITPEQEERLANIAGLASYSKEIEEKVVLSFDKKMDIANIKGVDSNYTVTTGVDSTVYWGSWSTDYQQGVAGNGIMRTLGLAIDRKPVKVLALKPGTGSLVQGSTTTDMYNVLPLQISGVYSVEASLDDMYVFLDLGLAQALLEKDSTQVSGISFKMKPDSDENSVREAIGTILGDDILLKNRQELNSNLYRMLNTENIAAYLIFTLVLIIALFNVVGAIIMMILDKQENSKTLFSLGATLRELRRIYFVQGVLVTTFGGLIGVLLGSILIGSQLAFGWVKIGSIDYPVEYQLQNVLIVLGTIIVLGVIASKIASSRINQKLLAA
ncbi:ABC transporter permease [Maribacter sp. 2307UL18-2]|uniref:ABC transporter permease n=1 Tax=Maribacter sp. 2307UL18-2 TaxID=3386274 RepID=UPI0039BD4612